METTIDRVVAAAGRYEGHGEGAESGEFTATLDIQPLVDGMGARWDYTATAPDGTQLHAEHTMLAFDMWSGEATLYVLCAELTGLGTLREISDHTFSNAAGVDGFELEIEFLVSDDGVTYVWSWGAPGEPLAERSRATLTAIAT